MEMNFLIVALAALVPLVMGFIWYGPLLFEKAWMKQMGFTKESLQGGNMLLIFVLSYVFSFMLAAFMYTLVIHQMGIQSTLFGEPGFAEKQGDAYVYFQNFMETYGDRFRTFKHGALHGALGGFFLALPVLSIQAMFERKSFKYIAINVGYWVVCLALMGGIICQWG